ncbi:MAG: O-antigen ligase family protein [Weizmannia coagulans]|uniref:O-antigen ligase family protein n=1 Tax=Heyndrickxia coagulans TaxID=1398 RepID=UPI0014599DF5|nr:O-antigen ligase family protein [Heyndrickxia coagulans]NMH83996.1 O-antigen ligase family protein [Heyndrickxia coagulans]
MIVIESLELSISYNVSILERYFYVFSYIVCTTAIFPLFFEESKINILIYTIIYPVYLFIFIKNYKQIIEEFVVENKILFILLLLVSISFLWSDIYLVSIQKILGFIGVTLIGIIFAYRLNFHELVKIMYSSYFIISVLSLITVTFLPNYGIHSDIYLIGDYKGVFTNKNTLGINMVFSIFSSFCLLFLVKKRSPMILVNVIISFYLLIKSNSKTSLIMLISLFLILILLFIIRKVIDKNLFIFFNCLFSIILGLILFFVYKNFDYFVNMLDRDPSMTGRSNIWPYVIHKIYDKPILGYGYYNFWNNPNYKLDSHFNAHDGFLDITLNVGIVGLLLFCFILLKTFFKGYHLIYKDNINILMFSLFILLFLYNIDETNYMLTNDIKWSLFLFIVLKTNSKISIKKSNGWRDA